MILSPHSIYLLTSRKLRDRAICGRVDGQGRCRYHHHLPPAGAGRCGENKGISRKGRAYLLSHRWRLEGKSNLRKGCQRARGPVCKSTPLQLRPDVLGTHSQTFLNSRFKKINILVNNTSRQYICKDFTQIDLGQVEDIFRTNILQMFAITKYALPHMSKGDS